MPASTLVRFAESDPALTIAVPHAADTVTHLPMPHAATAAEAVESTGVQAARRAVAAALIGTPGRPEPAGIDLGEMQRHSLATALVADA